jgi:phosphatidylglycerophosphate synthase
LKIDANDDMVAVVLGDSAVRLWGLTPAERLARQLRAERIPIARDDLSALAPKTTVLLLRGDCLYDARVIRGLAKSREALLEVEVDGRMLPVAAHVGADRAAAARAALQGTSARVDTAGIATVGLADVAKGYEAGLKKLDRPFVVPITEETLSALERLTFSGAYKGVTDLVTKFVWPAPAQSVTRWCANVGMTPNQVTGLSLVLVIVAGVLFSRGQFAWGLLAGWIMTFLDTVDGKLARVTITSTRLGNVFDHGIDLVHPPLWYFAWGTGLGLAPAEIAGIPLMSIYWAILVGYVGGRLCEGGFQLFIARFSIFTWRPFDSWFRLIAARRNPNMIMLTVSLALGRPDLGLLAVAAWTVASTLLLVARLLYAAAAKLSGRAMRSWLSEIGDTIDEQALSVRVFSHTAPAARRA